MITPEEASAAVIALSVLPFFPSEEVPRVMIANELVDMCGSKEQLEWLVKRSIRLWSKWESVRELRAIFCARFKPADGFEVSYSQVFPDGVVPPESPLPAPLPALPRGAPVSEDAMLDRMVSQLGEAVSMPEEPKMTSNEFHLAVAQKNDWRQVNDHNERRRMLVDMITAPPDRRPLESLDAPVAPFKQVTAEDIQAAQEEVKRTRQQRIENARAILADPDAKADAKFIAREILLGYYAL